jgi:phospholipid/cholesterol/gamma-HCH transport system substrate-binding protein
VSPAKKRGPDTATLLKFLAFVIFTSLLTLFIAQQIVGTSFGARYSLKARFDDVSGLLNGDPVKIAGVPSGQVASVKVVDGQALVTLGVDRGVRIPDDSRAEVRWRNVLGQRYIQLVPGTSSRMFSDGQTIRATRSVVDLSAIVNDLGPLTRNLDPTQITTVLTAFNQALDGNEGNINATITNLDGLLSTFAARKTAIDGMIKNFKVISGVIAKRDGQIAQSVDNLAELTQLFASNDKTLTDALDTISRTTGDLNTVLGGNQQQLGDIVKHLADFADTFRLNVNGLEQMVQQLPLTLRSLFAAGNGGQFLRTDALCLNLVQGPCPFKMSLPGGSANSNTGLQNNTNMSDLAHLAQMLKGGN